MTIFIGGAWPYANGSLHLGHVASLLPGDILARYYRLTGEEVLFVSGSDCHGTPISIRAEKEGTTPAEVAERYHQEFKDCFERLGFSYDLYTRTDDALHHRIVQDLFLKLLSKGLLELRQVEQTYCPTCNRFLPDRYVEGLCPRCGEPSRGDQCEACSTVLDPSDLLHRTCKLCGSAPEGRLTDHYYLTLSKLQEQLSLYAAQATGWRDNAVNLTQRYLNEGLLDRAATRDLPWGIDVPIEGFTGKKIYVWIEAVSGYYSASHKWAELTGGDWTRFWGEDTLSYYVHGKDNVPFHSLILPAILLGVGHLHLPDRIISGEYLTLEGKKISTSRNWAVWVPDVLERYHPDSLRYFLTANAPEKHDGDFSWREFINSHNGELLGAYGNFVNRNLAFIIKSFDGKVPDGVMDPAIRQELTAL
ncbi:MAG: methionine--tRNA ligase, partial [Gorillibacterium sp.]|nr:methionine--tRNA ligase [Gorillibacterium sp.]